MLDRTRNSVDEIVSVYWLGGVLRQPQKKLSKLDLPRRFTITVRLSMNGQITFVFQEQTNLLMPDCIITRAFMTTHNKLETHLKRLVDKCIALCIIP
jgi:hypothetical protein